MGVLGFVIVYVLPILFQVLVGSVTVGLGVYLGLRRYDKYKERLPSKEYRTQNRRKSIL